ncbi:MAG: plasmid pRiA4b ORF-3 family protein [bacterium]
MANIYQLKITLNDSNPPIWRRILIKSDILLPDLHKIIQTVMGWTNSHLHEFDINGRIYGLPENDEFEDENRITDYSSVKLDSLITRENEQFIYDYDFGDFWRHTILLEKILPVEKKVYYPKCIDGMGHCPPDDCGGIHRYAEILEIIKNPGNDEYEEMMEWLGDEFDPEYFNLDEINKLLKRRDYGCIELDD